MHCKHFNVRNILKNINNFLSDYFSILEKYDFNMMIQMFESSPGINFSTNGEPLTKEFANYYMGYIGMNTISVVIHVLESKEGYEVSKIKRYINNIIEEENLEFIKRTASDVLSH